MQFSEQNCFDYVHFFYCFPRTFVPNIDPEMPFFRLFLRDSLAFGIINFRRLPTYGKKSRKENGQESRHQEDC